jgi:hypothetical protein
MSGHRCNPYAPCAGVGPMIGRGEALSAIDGPMIADPAKGLVNLYNNHGGIVYIDRAQDLWMSWSWRIYFPCLNLCWGQAAKIETSWGDQGLIPGGYLKFGMVLFGLAADREGCFRGWLFCVGTGSHFNSLHVISGCQAAWRLKARVRHWRYRKLTE